jgi:hypothetical protein
MAISLGRWDGETPLTTETLTARCAEWQRRLRLQDWDVYLTIARGHELGEKTMGDCHPLSTKRQARIRILHPDDYAGAGFWPDKRDTWELTLVHELLHLHFHDLGIKWGSDGPQDIAGERAIDAIARALVFGGERCPS